MFRYRVQFLWPALAMPGGVRRGNRPGTVNPSVTLLSVTIGTGPGAFRIETREKLAFLLGAETTPATSSDVAGT